MSKQVECHYCGKSFSNLGIHNHIRRTHEGAKVNYTNFYKGKKMPKEKTVNFGNGKRGKIGVFKTSDETKRKLSEAALKSNHRRLVRSMREYTCVDGNVIILDSSWEEIVAKRLDELNIKWYRPTVPLKWIDSTGKERNYFPDFYLTDYDLYLDPKNPIAYRTQIEKVEYILNNYKNVVFLRSEEACILYCPW